MFFDPDGFGRAAAKVVAARSVGRRKENPSCQPRHKVTAMQS
jgi:hypothetical protein